MTPFAAAPGTFQLCARRERGRIVLERHAVIGWTHLQGSICFPLFAMNGDMLKGRKAILHPTGEVSDMRDGISFDDVEDWLDHISPQLEEKETNSASKDNVSATSDIIRPGKDKPGKSRAKSGEKKVPKLTSDLENLL